MDNNFLVKAEEMYAKGDGDVLVVLNLRAYESLLEVGVTREIVNRIQKLRKKSSLEPTNVVEVYLSLDDDETNSHELLESQAEYIRESLGSPLLPYSAIASHAAVLAEESYHGISNLSFSIILTRPALASNTDVIVALYNGNTSFTQGLKTYLLMRDAHNLKAEFQKGDGKIKVECVEGLPPLEVVLGEHVFLSTADYFSRQKVTQ